jgi:transcriptional regulator with XRE-family HTH domain
MGIRLKRLREAAGLTQARLALDVGVSMRALQNWEAGKRSFDFELGVSLARALGCTLDQLAGLEEASPKPRGNK